MGNISDDDFVLMVKRADLTLTDKEMDWVKETFNGYMERLMVLNSIDFEGEGIANSFLPHERLK